MSRHAPTVALLLLFVLAAAPTRAEGVGVLRRITSPSPRRYAQFGSAVAAIGTNVLVGAPNNEFGATTLPGAAYLIDPLTGTVLLTFTRPGSPVHDLFGYAVAVSGDDILIGAPGDPTQGLDNGAVYRFDAATGALRGQVLEPDPTPGTFSRQFGYALAVVDGNVLVGSGATNAAHLFDPATGTLLQSFTAPFPWTGPLGRSVAAFGHDVLLGAVADQTPGEIGGAAYLFDGSSAGLLQVFFNPMGAADDGFGSRVLGVDGDVFVGAPFNDAAGTNAGAVYQFDGGTGTLRYSYLPGEYDYFGLALAATDDGVLVGAQRGDAAFLLDAAAGTVLEDYDAPPSAANGEFGAAVGSVDGRVVVGAPLEKAGAIASGAVYVFDECGSGLVNQDEQCDDGNLLDGDGCSAGCRLELCAEAPRTDCRKPAAPGGAKLLVRNDLVDQRDRLVWTWRGALAGDELGTPNVDTPYLLCVYDAAAPSQPTLAFAALAGRTCGKKPCWRPSGSAGFTYHAGEGMPDGLTDLKLRPGGGTAITVKGKGPRLHLPPDLPVPPLTVQLVRGGAGVCWDADFTMLASAGGRISGSSD
jgi:cysteine-rich repeat protein